MTMDILLLFSFGYFCKMTGGEQKQVIYRSINIKCGESWIRDIYIFIIHYYVHYSLFLLYYTFLFLQGHSLKAALIV